ncbi:MAG: hypothetical protein J2P18_18100 [Nocardia sp.]|nr:hypothetical protein [Nocardia sp.]
MSVRVAVVGIDGCGKSSIIARLRRESVDREIMPITCPDFHETPNAPMYELSRQLKAIGEAADAVGNAVVKAATLYLRMTLYGPVEDFFLGTYRPGVLICERHPLIETLVYGPVYRRLARAARRRPDELETILAAAEQRVPGARAGLRYWQALQGGRTGIGSDIWTVIDEVAGILDSGTAGAVPRLAEVYRTRLPDTVLWLDTPVEEAVRRLVERGGGREIHESARYLTGLREGYLGIGSELQQHCPGVRFERIANADADGSEEVIARCLAATREPAAP